MTRPIGNSGADVARVFRSAHGAAAEHGALLVAEAKPLDELRPPNAADTERGLALCAARGRPFQVGNRAAAGRGPSLARVNADPDAPEERQRVHRKAASLQRTRARELAVMYGGPVSSAVKTELKLWALDVAWAEHYDRLGDARTASQLAEKSSAHLLKAEGYAVRDAQARPASGEEMPIGFIEGGDAS